MYAGETPCEISGNDRIRPSHRYVNINPNAAPYAMVRYGLEVMGQAPVRHPTNL